MNALSNRTLALLLVFAIAFSLGGTLLALGRINGWGITGMVTNTTEGNVNVTLTQRVAINLTIANLDFGTGYVGMGCNNCTIDTYSDAVNSLACCIGFNSPGTGLVIENTGNADLQVDANFTKNASAFIGGTNPAFRMRVVQNESQSCATLGATWATNSSQSVPVYNAGQTAGTICDRLTPNQNNDTIQIHINITIPDNSPSGSKNTSVIITGTGL